MSNFSDATLIIAQYLALEPNLFDGSKNPDRIVPDWFKLKNPIIFFSEEAPAYVGPESNDIKHRILNWINDPVFDLPDSFVFSAREYDALNTFQNSYNEWLGRKHEWDTVQNLIQLRKWIYWLTRYTNMNIPDIKAMEFAEFPIDIEDPRRYSVK